MTTECRKCGNSYHPRTYHCRPLQRYIAGHYDAKRAIKAQVKRLEGLYDKTIPFADMYEIIKGVKP